MTDLQQAARDHLWLHFTRMGSYADGDVPIIVRGDGCYLEDAEGRRYLDALAGLFCVNIGYSYGEEMGQAALAQMRELPFYTNWSYAHPRSIELAAEIASLAPGDLNRVFFVSGGSEAVEAAWKLARQYYLARGTKRLTGPEVQVMHDEHVGARCRGSTRRSRARSRTTARRSGRCRSTASRRSACRSSRSCRRCGTSRTRTATTARGRRRRRSSRAFCWPSSSRRSSRWARRPCASCTWSQFRTRAAASPRRPATFAGVRQICDRYDILLSADEVITGFGRVGGWFASERYDIRPDIVCIAKGLSSAYAAIGGVVATDR